MPDLKKYRIVLPENPTYNERRAADFITSCVKIVAGYKIPTVKDTEAPYEYELCVGRTNREVIDGLSFDRCVERTYEGLLFGKGNRIYFVGLGINTEKTDKPFKSYEYINDGAYGALYAAYRFVEDTVGYNFLYAVNESYPENTEIEVDPSVSVTLTREYVENELPKKTDGDVMYVFPSVELQRNADIIVIKTQKGGLSVVGGGLAVDAEHVVSVLESLSDGKKPFVESWFVSRLHPYSTGALAKILEDSRVEIGKIYAELMPREFYTDKATDKNAECGAIYDILTASGKLCNVKTGDIISLDSVDVRVMFAPIYDENEKMSVGSSGVVYRVETENKKVLLMGESGEKGGRAILEGEINPKSDAVILTNYGGVGIPEAFFKAVAANECVFSVGIRDLYGEYGEGLYTRNTGIIRSRDLLMSSGVPSRKQYRTTFGVQTLPL